MGAASHPHQGFADQALRQLGAWPALTVCRAVDGAGRGLKVGTRQIVHLHAPDEAEVYLTRPVVQRMADALTDSGGVTIEPGADWVRVRLDHPGDLTLLGSLVSVAIKTSTPVVPHRRIPPCPHAQTAAREQSTTCRGGGER
ncbi:luciferase family protein [Spirillospora sp. CA-142024]|uniref:luciferase domain-containing protein n=1 Tax=Spirillospora sp. CA-142024 TaxID=3240036 RepID=UPI003D947895